MNWFKSHWKKFAKTVVAVVTVAAVAAAFYGFPTHHACRIQPAATITFAVIVVLALFIGRFFCSCLCPLGVLQSFVNMLMRPRKHVRRVCTRLPETNAQRVVRWTVVAAFIALGAAGWWGLAWAVDPYSIFGKAVTLWIPGLAVFGFVLALSLVGNGRFWCNWICPFGTLFNLFARHSIGLKDSVEKRCGNCRRCFPKKPAEAKTNAPKAEAGVTRREAFKGLALFAAADFAGKLTDGGYAPVSLPGIPDRGVRALPPGAQGHADSFGARCVSCQLCVANCPEKCIQPSVKLKNFGQPEMDYRFGHCRLNCTKCGEVCPTGAIKHLTKEQKVNTHIGVAMWDANLCIRHKVGDKCTACERKCPVHAIHIINDTVSIDAETCLGCGACEHVCPARPMPAIHIKGLFQQRTINPMADEAAPAKMVDDINIKVKKGKAYIIKENDFNLMDS